MSLQSTRRLSIIVLGLFLLTACREETHEERRYRMWKEDFKACDIGPRC